MSQEKREQLMSEGKLREDGSRIVRCPVCTQEVPDELIETVMGTSGAGEGEPTAVGASDPAQEDET